MNAGDAELSRLDKAVIRLWRVHALGRVALLMAAAVAAVFLFDLPFSPVAPAAVIAICGVAWLVLVPPLRYRAWRYALREADLYLRHGVLFRTTSIVPLARIQHVDTRHGPLDRWLGLSTLVVFTAGTRGAIVAIPGLAAATAESLRDRLARRSGEGDAV